MAMIKCPDCGKEYSSYAKACPECGCPVEYCETKTEYAGAAHSESGENQSSLSQNATEAVNYDDFFLIKEDEYEGKKIVFPKYDMSGNQELDRLSDSLGVSNPCVDVVSVVNKEGTRFYICYDERDLIESLDNDENEPCKGIFVIIDDETLRIDAEDSRDGLSIFPIEQDQLLRLCYSHTIEFKIFKREGKAIVIQGNKEDEEMMIASIQSLYDYTTGNRLFPDAAVKIQRWINNIRAKHAEMERKQEAEQAAVVAEDQAKGERNIIIGIVTIVVGVIMCAIGATDLDLALYLCTMSVIPILLGLACLLFGIQKKKGLSDKEALNRVVEIFQQIKTK